MSTFAFSILSPSGKAFEGRTSSVMLPGGSGGFGILSGHAPMIAAVQPGLATVRTEEGERFFYTGEGVVEVTREAVVLLVDESKALENPSDSKDLVAERTRKTGAR